MTDDRVELGLLTRSDSATGLTYTELTSGLTGASPKSSGYSCSFTSVLWGRCAFAYAEETWTKPRRRGDAERASSRRWEVPRKLLEREDWMAASSSMRAAQWRT